MSQAFERIINLMNFGNRANSSTLEQHCSAMRMDDDYSWTFNRLNYAISDARKELS